MTYDERQPKLRIDHIALVICPSCKGAGIFYGWDGCTGVACLYCRGAGEVLEPSYSCEKGNPVK